MNPFGLLFAAGGIFAICGALFDWEFFMGSRKARFFVMILGRAGARVFYMILGAFLTGLGMLAAFGYIPLNK